MLISIACASGSVGSGTSNACSCAPNGSRVTARSKPSATMAARTRSTARESGMRSAKTPSSSVMPETSTSPEGSTASTPTRRAGRSVCSRDAPVTVA